MGVLHSPRRCSYFPGKHRCRFRWRLLLVIRRLAAEALGTGLLIVAVIGSGIMATNLTDDVALQLLCNAVATGGALVALILIFAPVS